MPGQTVGLPVTGPADKGLFTRRERYPSKRVKVSSGLRANFTGRGMPTCFVMRDILCNGPRFKMIMKFSMENALNSRKRENIIIVDRK